MIEVTPPRPFGPNQGILWDKGQMTPCSTPQAPQTTTPMIKTRLAAYTTDMPTDNVLTPQATHLPPQPATVTPMIKPSSERVETQSSLSPEPGSPDLPMPPTMGTTGLRAFSPLALESSRPEVSFSLDSLPPPPDVTSVQILKPGKHDSIEKTTHLFKELCHGDFDILGLKLPQIKTKYLCRTRNAYRTLRGGYQVNLWKRFTIIRVLACFPRHKAINLKVAIRFHPGHLQPKTYFFFTLKACMH